jgi:predicted ATP-grasp superfamily ATP-dependent carboligase
MDLVRPLGLAGIRCAVVARPGDPIRYSRFTETVLEWSDSWKEPEPLVERLVRWAATRAEPPVLFYQEDRDLLLVSRFRSRLSPAFRFVVPEASLVEDLVDKGRFQDLAERAGLPVPPTRRLRPGEGSLPEDADLRFPVIVKPLTRRTDSWVPIAGSNKALRVETPGELRALWPRLAEADLEVLAQELVPGDETRIESYHVYVDEAGDVVGDFTGRKIRTHPAEFGYSTALEITDAADVRELGRELARRLDLRGVAKLDFKRAPDGRLYLLEVNPRFNLWHHPAALAGVNIPDLVFRDLSGRPRPAEVKARAGVRWCYLWYDAAAAREWGVTPARWLPWALSCEAKSSVAADDPMPFIRGVLLRKAGTVLGRLAARQ